MDDAPAHHPLAQDPNHIVAPSALLVGAASSDIAERTDARAQLLAGCVHAGGGRFGMSRPVAHALLVMLPDPSIPDRAGLIELLMRLVVGVPEGCWWGGNDTFGARHALARFDVAVLPSGAEPLGALDDVQAGLPTVIALLGDSDPQVRAAAVALAGLLPEARSELAPAARRMLLADPDLVAATCAALSLGMLCGGRSRPDDVDVLRGFVDQTPNLATATAVARVWHGDIGDDVLRSLRAALQLAASTDGSLIVPTLPWPDADLAPFVLTAYERVVVQQGTLDMDELADIMAVGRNGPAGRRRLCARLALAHAFGYSADTAKPPHVLDTRRRMVLEELSQREQWWIPEATDSLLACDLPDTAVLLARLGLPTEAASLAELAPPRRRNNRA